MAHSSPVNDTSQITGQVLKIKHLAEETIYFNHHIRGGQNGKNITNQFAHLNTSYNDLIDHEYAFRNSVESLNLLPPEN